MLKGVFVGVLLAVSAATAIPGIHQLESDAHHSGIPGFRQSKIDPQGHPECSEGPRPKSKIHWGPLIVRTDTSITRQVYGYMPNWATQNYLHFDLLTAIGLFDVTLNPDGSISNWSNFPDAFAATIARAHRNGVRCEVVATCFGWWNIEQAITVGADSALHNLVQLAETTGMDGINMDFEDILGADRDTMVCFMRRLSAACRARGLTLTMATMPLDFQNAYDFAALAETTDGLFMMEYNFHWPGCPEAGPTAPLSGWDYYGNLQGSLAQYLGAIGNGRKLLFGMPYYGYDWPTLSDTTHARTSGTGADLYYVNARPGAQLHGRRWDSEGSVPWYCYDNSGMHQGWYDDDSSLMLKYQEVYAHDLLGTGMWALGYDGARTELWAALRESFNRPNADIVNGDFETWRSDTFAVPGDTGLKPDGWYEGRHARVRREAVIRHTGSYALKQMPDSLGDSWPASSDVFQDVQVTPEEGYEFSAWARKNDHLGNRMKLTVQWYDNLHRVIGVGGSDELTTDDSTWQWLRTYSLIAPPSAAFARLGLHVTGYGGADHWDDVCFVPSMALAASPVSGVAMVSFPTVVRGVVQVDRRQNAIHRTELLDICGRRVGKLHAGVNDVSRLAPGVYFVRSADSGQRAALTKVIVAR
jgi:hypothetical protein